MFPTFISILDIQSWWEVPSIAHFCSLFRSSFNLLDFDIEDLEEALLTDGTEENSWLQELIVCLLTGCLPNNEISTFNYQMFLRRLFREKCKEHDRYNPFNTDIDFQLLPLRTKVDILYALCDFRLDADDVLEQLKNLEADSLRVEPLGYDDNDSAYWYFYGTRLYREDFKSKNKKGSKSVWQVICFTQEDWFQLAKKFKKSQSKNERHLYHTLNGNFLPELPRLFHEKERLARKRLLESQPRRTSDRIGTKKKQELEADTEKNNLEGEVNPEQKSIKKEDLIEDSNKKELIKKRKESFSRRAKLRDHIDEIEPESRLSESEQKEHWKKKYNEDETDTRSCKSEKSESSNTSGRYEMARDKTRGKKSSTRQRKNSGSSCSGRDNGSSISRTTHSASHRNSDRSRGKQAAYGDAKGSATTGTPRPTTTVGRQTNNSLAAATGQIVIQPVSNPHRKKLKTSQVFRQTEEDLQVGMHKILDCVKNHEDAWPFVDPVEEKYAPNYYSVIRKPMDLQRMEDRLDSGYYKTFSRFRADFQLIVDNCRLYNGVDNEYTEMVGNLAQAFEKGTEKYLDQISSSDEEIRIEYLTAESESKNSSNISKKETAASSSTSSKRKPTLVAKTDKKRDRSSSVESIKKKREIVENIPKVKTKKDVKKEPSHVKESALTKTKNKTNEKHKKKTKKNSKSSKKSAKKNSRSGSTFSRSRSGSLVDRSTSRSPQNQRWSSSPPPPSWPPSPRSPKDLFDFDSKNNVKRPKKFSEEDKISNSGKDKENKKDKWDEIFRTSDPKPWDKKSDKPISPQRPKDKHNKLRETIEKLKAKSEISKKYKDPYLEDLIFNNPTKESRTSSPTADSVDTKKKKSSDNKRKEKKDKSNRLIKRSFDLDDGNSTADSIQSESKNKKNCSKNTNSNTTKNATIEALALATEQTLKDINKWLDDTPRLSEFSSASNSPTHYLISDEIEGISTKIEQDLQKKVEKSLPKKDGINKDLKKRSFSRDPTKFLKKREIQRTIDRLQPGKSKGNLLSNVQNANKTTDEVFPLGPISKNKDLKNSLIVKTDENAPKLSLGSVLDSFGKHKFVDDLKKDEESPEVKSEEPVQTSNDKQQEDTKDKQAETEKPDVEKTAPDPLLPQKQVSPGKATPNLSAWFKAFGAPKVQSVQKKLDSKLDDKVEESKLKDEQKKVSPPESSPNSEGLHGMPVPRQRKASTGSSVSERSSFSQDMDSPRVGIDERIGAYPAPYPSPLHKSPSGASPLMPSPRPDVSPKSAAYPTLNGQIRVGFYQDTVSTKSSPENPQSPYYPEHIYSPASMQNAPPNYSYNNSPYYPPNYSNSNPTPPYNSDGNNVTYYDTNKPLTDQYQAKATAGYHQPLNSPNYQPSSNSPNYSANSPNIQKNSPHYSPHSPSCNSVHSPNLSSGPNSPINSPNYQPSSNSPLNSPNYGPSSNSPANSPNYPPPNSPGFNSANSPNYPALNSPHSPVANPSNFQSANSPGYQTNSSPSCQPVNSPGYQAANSPGYQASNSISSPHYPAANSPNYPAPNSPGYTMSNSPGYQQVGPVNYQNANKNGNFSSTSGFQRINAPDSSNFKPPTPTGFREPNSPLASPYPVHQEFDEFQQNKQAHSNIFPVKKRAFSDINSVPQHQEASLPGQPQNIFPNRNFDTNIVVNQQINNEMTNQLQHPNQNTLQSPSQVKTTVGNQFHQDHEMIHTKNVMSSNSALKESVLDPETKRNLNFGSLTNLYGPGSNYPLNIPSARPLDLNARPESKTSSMQESKTDSSAHYVDQLNSYGMPGNLQQSIMGQPRLGSEGLGNRLNSATTGNYKPAELSNPYKNPDTSRPSFSTPAPTSLSAMEQSLNFQRNLATLSHIVDRFQTGERLLQGLQSTASYYSDKNLVSHVYTKPMTTTSASLQQMFGQSVNQYSGQDVQNSMFNRAMELHNPTTNQPQQQVQQQQSQPVTPQVQEKKSKRKKSAKAAASVAPPAITEASAPSNINQGFQSYTGLKNVDPSAISLKAPSVVPGSAFNFGPAAAAASSLGLSSGLYGEKDAYSNFLEEYRTTPNYYMAAAAAAHHRSTPETTEKQARTAHQQPVTAASAPSYPFIGAPQPRPPSYPFMTPHQASTLMDPSSPLYQQYLQAGVLHQGLLGAHGAYPAGYHPALGMRQPFDSMTRPPWL